MHFGSRGSDATDRLFRSGSKVKTATVRSLGRWPHWPWCPRVADWAQELCFHVSVRRQVAAICGASGERLSALSSKVSNRTHRPSVGSVNFLRVYFV